jgi:hypothetical protein
MTPVQTPPRTEADYRLSYKRIDAVVTIVKNICAYGWPVLCMYFLYKIAVVLAGKTTLASFAMSVAVAILGNNKVMKTIYVVLTGGSIAYGVGQRQLRRREIKRHTKRPRELEKLIDPGRSSSGLTSEGTTRPEDRE